MKRLLILSCIVVFSTACGSPQPAVFPAAPKPIATANQSVSDEPTPGGPTPVLRVTREANQTADIIAQYAVAQLGLNVSVARSGGVTAVDLGLPASTASTYQTAFGNAVESYGGVLANGTAAIGFGAGANSGDLIVDTNINSIGAFTIDVAGTTPGDAAAAVDLIRATFPALSGSTFTTRTSDNGFSFFSSSTENVMDPKTMQLLPKNTLAGVVATSNGTRVYAIVGTGAFATALAP